MTCCVVAFVLDFLLDVFPGFVVVVSVFYGTLRLAFSCPLFPSFFLSSCSHIDLSTYSHSVSSLFFFPYVVVVPPYSLIEVSDRFPLFPPPRLLFSTDS